MGWHDFRTEKPEWADEMDETLYVLTVGDLIVAVDDVKGEGTWEGLSPDQRREVTIRAEKNVSSMMGHSDWSFALGEAFEDWEEESKKVASR